MENNSSNHSNTMISSTVRNITSTTTSSNINAIYCLPPDLQQLYLELQNIVNSFDINNSNTNNMNNYNSQQSTSNRMIHIESIHTGTKYNTTIYLHDNNIKLKKSSYNMFTTTNTNNSISSSSNTNSNSSNSNKAIGDINILYSMTNELWRQYCYLREYGV
jgi:hypothetical protein